MMINPRPSFVERIRLHQLVAGTHEAHHLIPAGLAYSVFAVPHFFFHRANHEAHHLIPIRRPTARSPCHTPPTTGRIMKLTT